MKAFTFIIFLFGLNIWAHEADISRAPVDKKLNDSIDRAVSSESENYQVYFNTKTKKYHRMRCRSAKACTKNCIEVSKSEAISNKGVPCGNCGG